MKLSVYTQPATEPVSLVEAKAHLRVAHTDDDSYITSLIEAARRSAEFFTKRAFITQTLELALDVEPSGGFVELPMPPLASVTSVKYYADDDTATTMDSADYHVDIIGEPGRVVLLQDASWPTAAELRTVNAYVIRYVAGYGTASAVPEQIKAGIREIIRKMYDGEAVLVKGSLERELLTPYRVVRVV